MTNSNSIFFSVLIPLYNKEKFIAKTLESVLKQTYTNFEIIIVNDGSTDKSLEVISSIKSDKIKIYDQENQGVSLARNKCIALAKGNYLALLDADDYWYPNHLQHFTHSINKYKNKVVFCNNYEIEIFKKNIKHTVFSFPFKKEKTIYNVNFFKSSLLNSTATSSSICVKKEVLTEGFLFNDNIKSGEDTDLWVRLGLEHNFIFNKNVSIKIKKYVEGSLSESSNTFSRSYFTNKYVEQEKNNPDLKKFMDNNRFSVAVEAKLLNEKQAFKNLKQKIDPNNLNFKQKLILKLPNKMIILLKNFKLLLAKLKINTTVYK